MRFVPRDDRSQLTAARDAKMRVRLSLDLADARLTRIEELTSQKQFERASEALGNYLGLIEDAKYFIGSLIQDKNSTRDLYRRLDIALRAHIPRLAVARRATPNDYAVHLKTAEEFARTTRSEALESFYGNTVLREPGGADKAGANKTSPPQENKRP
jgi:cytosine/adenosine deaminase-related metal-dependent hydrolase